VDKVKKQYIVPKLTVVGTAAEMTEDFNKDGFVQDTYSGQVPVVGSLTPPH
jgi:hypothetical protein